MKAILLIMLMSPLQAEEAWAPSPFLEGSLVQAVRLSEGGRVDPALEDEIDRLKARMEAWLVSLPGSSGAGIVDRASKSYGEARSRSREVGLLVALEGRLTEALVERAAIHRSRDVRAADQTLEAVIRRYPQTAHLDNLLVQYQDLAVSRGPAAGTAPAPMDREGRAGDGTLAIKGDITTAEVEMAAVDAGLARRNAVTAARSALAQMVWARDAAAAVRDLERIVGRLMEVIRIRLAAGTASQGELLRLEVLMTDLKLRRRNLGDEAARARAALAAVLDLPVGVALGAPAGIELPRDLPSMEALVRGALSRRHELKRLRLEIRKLGQVIELQKARYLPDLASGMSDLRAPFAKDGQLAFPEAGPARVDVFLGGREAWLDELRERGRALIERRRDLEARVRAEVESARHTLSLHRRTWRAHSGEMLEKTRHRVELERMGYQQGTRSFLDVMEAEEEFIRHRLEGINALRDARLAWAALRDKAMLF